MSARTTILKVVVSPEEKRQIEVNAAACGMTLSAYARTLALGYQPACLNDLNELEKVFKLHADQSRLGGLLKMLLTNDERMRDMAVGKGMAVATVEDTLFNIRNVQEELRIMVEAVVDSVVAMKGKYSLKSKLY